MTATDVPPTMRAAVVERPGVLTLTTVPTPVAARGEVLVAVEACGVCHSDIHAIDGDWSPPPELPLIPGHEIVGRVVALGADAPTELMGRRVGVAWNGGACGHCTWCRSEMETLCPEAEMTGYTRPGGFAEFLSVRADFVAPLPEDVDAIAVAPILCAGVTTYRGLKRGGATRGQHALISGVGGLGHVAVQYARALGLKVAAADTSAERRDLALQLGAEICIDPADDGIEARLSEWSAGGPDVVVVTATAPRAFEDAVRWTRPGGCVVFIGLPSADRDRIGVSIANVSNFEKTIRGSNVGTRADLKEALDFVIQGQVRARVEAVGFDQLPQAIERLRTGAVTGRIVIDIAKI